MTFLHTSAPSRVVFGAGTLSRLPDEVRRSGRTRVLLVFDPGMTEVAGRVSDMLGPLLAGSFGGAAMHTPVEVTDRALREMGDADCVVSLGGGSATGLGKALSARTGHPQIAIPTTYAGSEVTPVLGETRGAEKVTRSSPEILPEVVIYDVELTLSLPVDVSVTSGVNAMAHAVEALYSPDATPVTDQLAVQSLTRLSRALPRIVADPADGEARSDALIGAWLAGICLGSAGMGPHHRVCHYLGGAYGMPHAATHTVVLPHAMAYMAAGAPAAMARIAEALGVPDAPAGMYDLVARLGGPTSLRALGLPDGVTGPFPSIVEAAYAGERPAGGTPDPGWLTEEVVKSFAGTPSVRLRELMTDLVRTLHGYARRNELTQAEWQQAVDFLTRTGAMCSATRQEFVLLSDTLGLSSMVDLLENSRNPESTPSAVLGPFYVPGPPVMEAGADLAVGLPGEPLAVDVAVVGVGGEPIAGAVVDVWQSDEDGFYDVQLPVDGPVLRGRFHSDSAGRVRFRTIVPSAYPIPDDGPVGEMLAVTGRHQWRAPHLHFMIDAPGYRRLITQLFVAGGAYLESDTVFGVKAPLVVDFSGGRVGYTFRIQPVSAGLGE